MLNNEAKKILEKAVRGEEITREDLSVLYIEKCVGTELETLVPKIVDGGEEKTLDYYLGAEKIAIKSISIFEELNLEMDSTQMEALSAILGYISHKIVMAQKQEK